MRPRLKTKKEAQQKEKLALENPIPKEEETLKALNLR